MLDSARVTDKDEPRPGDYLTASDQSELELTGGLHNVKPSRKPRVRAGHACLACRARKVRCNVAIHGAPCVNCRIDNKECATVPSDKRKRRPTKVRAVPYTPISPAQSPDQWPIGHDQSTSAWVDQRACEVDQPGVTALRGNEDVSHHTCHTKANEVLRETTCYMPLEAESEQSAQQEVLQCRLTAALLYFNFKHVMRPGRLADVESSVDIYCQQMGNLNGNEQENRISELQDWSGAIRKASDTIAAVDSAMTALGSHVIRFSAEVNRKAAETTPSIVESLEIPSYPRLLQALPTTAQASGGVGGHYSCNDSDIRAEVCRSGHESRSGRSPYVDLEWDSFLRSPTAKATGVPQARPLTPAKNYFAIPI